MNTRFTARHFNASDQLQQHAIASAEKLQKFYDGIIDCEIVLQPNKDPELPQLAEFNIRVAKDHLKASEAAPTYEQAIGKVVDNMKRQLLKYKNKKVVKN